MLHAWERYGLAQANSDHWQNHEKRTLRMGRSPAYDQILAGKIEFLGFVRGHDDAIYRGLKRQFAILAGVHLEDPEESILQESIWVVENELDCKQGTAFWLKDIGLVTCSHCLGPKPYAFSSRNPQNKIPLHVVLNDQIADLAVLRALDATISPTGLIPSRREDACRIGTKVILAGFPNYAPGRSISVKHGSITARSQKFNERRFNISCSVVFGNSGGPVMDAHSRVLGIAVMGTSSEREADITDEHAFIPINRLTDLFKHMINQAEV